MEVQSPRFMEAGRQALLRDFELEDEQTTTHLRPIHRPHHERKLYEQQPYEHSNSLEDPPSGRSDVPILEPMASPSYPDEIPEQSLQLHQQQTYHSQHHPRLLQSRRTSSMKERRLHLHPRTRFLSSRDSSMTSSMTSSQSWRRSSSLAPFRTLGEVYHGWMWKQGSNFKTWKKRYFILNGNILTYYDQCCVISSDHTGTRCLDVAPKGGLRVAKVAYGSLTEFGLEVVSSAGRSVFVQCENEMVRNQWFHAFSRACIARKMGSLDSSSNASRETNSSDSSGLTECSSPELRSFVSTLSSEENYSMEKSGWLYVRGQLLPHWKRRFVVLSDGMVVISRDEAKKPQDKVYEVLAVNPWNGRENAFCVTLVHSTTTRMFCLSAESAEEAFSWMETLRGSI